MNFNFYGYLKLEINTNNHRGYEKYFTNEYARICADQKDYKFKTIPKISVFIVDSLPKCLEGDLKRQVNVKKLFTFNYLVRGINTDSVEIYFKRHYLDRIYMNAIAVFLQAQVIEPIMYYKLLDKNVLFMHAGGVTNGKEGFLFPAHGGTGKTTFSMALLNKGFSLLGDDLLFVVLDEKIVYPYPRPMHIFTYNVDNLVGAKVPLSYRLKVYSKNVLRFFLERILNTEFLISTRIHADQVFEGSPFGEKTPYKRIFFLRKEGAQIEHVSLTENDRSDLITEIINSADLNDSLYQLLDDQLLIERAKRLERKVVGNLIEQISEFSYINTRKLDLNNLDVFVSEYFA